MTLIEEKYKQKLFFLRLLYGKVIEIIDATKSGYVMFDDEILNHHYIQLSLNIDTILKEKKFKNLNKEAPQIFDSLLGNSEEIDIAREYLKDDLLRFIGKIQKECIMANVIDYTLSKEDEEFFNNIDKAINKHKEIVKLYSEELVKPEASNLNGLKGQFNKHTLNDEGKIKDTNEKIKCWIEYKETREIILNISDQRFMVNRLQFNRSNELLFKYIFSNKKKKIKINEIKKGTGVENINFNKFVSNIGFKGELRKCFFNVSKTTIQFIDSLTTEELEKRNSDISKLKKGLKKL